MMAYKVLIVDDSMLVRNGLTKMFEKSGNWSEIVTAENGKIAVEKVLSEQPDAMCMDVEMPEMDGIEALKKIVILKKQGKVPASLPIVILSGTLWQNEEQARKIRLYGASDIMAKPDGKSSTIMIQFKTLEEKLLTQLEKA